MPYLGATMFERSSSVVNTQIIPNLVGIAKQNYCECLLLSPLKGNEPYHTIIVLSLIGPIAKLYDFKTAIRSAKHASSTT